MTELRINSPDVTWQELGDEVVVLDLATSRYLSLNATAAQLWRRIADGADTDELVGAVVEEFEVPREQAHEDVTAFVGRCRELGLLA
jgi:hypothetical protein